MRPHSIILFERIYWVSIAIATVSGVWTLSHIDQVTPPDVPLAIVAIMPLIAAVILASAIGINVALWYFVARRRSNVARWIFTVLVGLALVAWLRRLIMTDTAMASLAQIGAAVRFLLQIACVWLLFRHDAEHWFRGRPPQDLHDVFS